MIRPTIPADQFPLLTLARETEVFKPLEIDALEEVLNDYHATNHAHGHRSVTYEDAGEVLGFAYYAPAAMTDHTWYLYWIAVTKRTQARGIGGALLKFAEDDIRQRHGRILLIETSSLSHYELTRRFYIKQQYDEVAIVPDYYADGDSMVVYRKRLNG
ncbi:MAG TPA: GNAT family N-acetyltransferase [Pirellulales bacterium]|nr:GNAT family N-acetyltransferase [Pirellulales bacterium]